MNTKIQSIDRNPWLERLVLFVVSYTFWLCLVWPLSPLDGRWLVGDILAGIPVSVFVALVMGEIMTSYFDGITLGDMKGLPWRILNPETIGEDVAAITKEIEERKVPGALIVAKGILDASS